MANPNRVDCTEAREEEILDWVTAKPYANPYKRLGKSALALLSLMADGKERQRTDMFREVGLKANYGGNYTNMTDFKLFTSRLLSLRATGIPGHRGFNGIQTFWTITERGREALELLG